MEEEDFVTIKVPKEALPHITKLLELLLGKTVERQTRLFLSLQDIKNAISR